MDLNRVIDNYVIEHVGGRKVIHYNGFVWPNEHGIEYDDEVPEYLADEMTFCYVPVDEYTKERLNGDMELVKQYQYPLFAGKDALEYLSGLEHLPLSEVNEDTPYGNYWCYIEEE